MDRETILLLALVVTVAFAIPSDLPAKIKNLFNNKLKAFLLLREGATEEQKKWLDANMASLVKQ